MTATRLIHIPGLAEDVAVEPDDIDAFVPVAARRSRCIDCDRVVRVNDTADKFWPWVAEDDAVICSAQVGRWGHRVPNAIADWLKDGA